MCELKKKDQNFKCAIKKHKKFKCVNRKHILLTFYMCYEKKCVKAGATIRQLNQTGF